MLIFSLEIRCGGPGVAGAVASEDPPEAMTKQPSERERQPFPRIPAQLPGDGQVLLIEAHDMTSLVQKAAAVRPHALAQSAFGLQCPDLSAG
jgi:hypothetical protein